ncbi:MAG: hypothetical protein R3336_09965 [Phycisphaeraceae bacterium]|nr:hypothetical protein [Phycisphaeraceae bacterium]
MPPEGERPIPESWAVQWKRGIVTLALMGLVGTVAVLPVWVIGHLAEGLEGSGSLVIAVRILFVLVAIGLAPILAYRLAFRLSFGFQSWFSDHES